MGFLIKLLSFFIRAHPRESVAKDFAALPRYEFFRLGTFPV